MIDEYYYGISASTLALEWRFMNNEDYAAEEAGSHPEMIVFKTIETTDVE